MARRYTSTASKIKLTERQAQVLVAACSWRLDSHSGPAYFEWLPSLLTRVVNQLTAKGLVAYDLGIVANTYRYIPLKEGEAWVEGCSDLPELPALMSAVANMYG